MPARSLIKTSVQAFYCGNPLCVRKVSATRKWQRFCSNECCQQASIIRRAAKLLANLPDQPVIDIIRNFARGD